MGRNDAAGARGDAEWYRALIRLRRSTPCLNDGKPGRRAVTFDEQEKWLRMERGTISVICNLGELEQRSGSRAEPACCLQSRRTAPAQEGSDRTAARCTVAVLAGIHAEMPDRP